MAGCISALFSDAQVHAPTALQVPQKQSFWLHAALVPFPLTPKYRPATQDCVCILIAVKSLKQIPYL